MNGVKIRDIRTILTQPDNNALAVVKVETTEPGLYGLGCATYDRQPFTVKSAVDDYLRPFLIGRSVSDIEDIWQSANVSSYWRNGTILGDALSGVDQALWDIKGKMADMPVYDLLGGRAREAAAVYVHPSGPDNEAVEDQVRDYIEQGFQYLRVQVETPGYQTYGAHGGGEVDGRAGTMGGPRAVTSWRGGIFEPKPYMNSALSLFDHLRSKVGWDFDMLHDVHERIPAIDGVWLAKEVEQYRLFFLEDLFTPEDQDYFRQVRQICTTPIAMGELWSNPHEIIPMVKDRLVDFIRIHVSRVGGLTPCRKYAALSELFGVRTVWHGPGGTSPVGHAANLMLELNTWNFGVHEWAVFPDRTREVFPGCPEVRDGHMWPNGAPGLGIDIDEKLAAKYPIPERDMFRELVRRADGAIVRP